MKNLTITMLSDLPFFSGIGQYTEDLINFLISNGYNIRYISYFPYRSNFQNLHSIQLPLTYDNFKSGQNLRMITCSNLFQFRKFVTPPTHITSQFLMPLGFGKKNVAITVHDLNQLHTTGYDFISTGLMAARLNLLRKYENIVADSNFVKQDILNHFRVDENRIHVIYNWIDLSRIKIPNSSKKRSESETITLIHVGNDQQNKNINLIYELLNKLPSSYQLIRVGSNSKRNIRYVERMELRKRIKFYQGISSEKLDELYNLADIFIYPSTNEGFGRPLLEAMAHGLPVIYRNSSSLPEIAGNSGIPFDNDSLDEIVEKVMRTAELDSYSKMSKKSIERSRFFDISNIKGTILKFYDELIA